MSEQNDEQAEAAQLKLMERRDGEMLVQMIKELGVLSPERRRRVIASLLAFFDWPRNNV